MSRLQRIRPTFALPCFVGLAFAFASHSLADESWRGFRDSGSNTVHADLPTEWSPEKGVAWHSKIPGYGQSSPVVWQGQVYLTSSDGPFQEHCQVHAYSLKDGTKLWTSNVAVTTKVENYFRNSRAAGGRTTTQPSSEGSRVL